jgi:predicted dehydrogenase
VFLEASWASNIERDRFYVTLMGTEGGADLEPLRIYTEENGHQVDIAPHAPAVHGHQAEARHFVDCIRENRTPLATGEHGLDVVKILDAIYRSAETGEMVRIA